MITRPIRSHHLRLVSLGLPAIRPDVPIIATARNIKLTVNNEDFYFTGVIDRADVNNDDIAVIDYKTGASGGELQKVYYGQKIQLYVYLKYFLERGYRPAGVFYLPIKSGYYAGGTSYAMTGQMRDSLQTLFDLDDRVEENAVNEKFASPTVDFSVENKKGELKFCDRGGNRLMEEEFRYIVDYVFKITEQAISDIQNGDIEKNPMEGACKGCPYARMCGEEKERVKCTVKKTDFYGGSGGDQME